MTWGRQTGSHHEKSPNKQIAYATAWVAAFLLFGKAAGAVKEATIAWKYGVGEIVDAYQLAFTLVTWLPNVIVGVLTSVLVPLLSRTASDELQTRDSFFREVVGTAIIAGVLATACAIAACHFALPLFTRSLSARFDSLAQDFVFGLAVICIPFMLSAVFSMKLMAEKKQVNTLLEAVPAFALVASLTFASTSNSIAPLIIGTVAGLGLQTIALVAISRRRSSRGTGPLFTHRSTHWQGVYKALGIMALGQIVMTMIGPLDQYFAASMGSGQIAALNYANRVLALFLGLGALALSRAALPVLSRMQTTGDTVQAAHVCNQWARLMLAAGAIAAAVGWLIAPQGVELIFQRGAFTENNTSEVAHILRFGLLQVPFYFSGMVFVQYLASQGRYRMLAVSGLIGLTSKIPLNLFFTTHFGIAGISLATGAMYAVSLAYLGYCARSVQTSN